MLKLFSPSLPVPGPAYGQEAGQRRQKRAHTLNVGTEARASIHPSTDPPRFARVGRDRPSWVTLVTLANPGALPQPSQGHPKCEHIRLPHEDTAVEATLPKAFETSLTSTGSSPLVSGLTTKTILTSDDEYVRGVI